MQKFINYIRSLTNSLTSPKVLLPSIIIAIVTGAMIGSTADGVNLTFVSQISTIYSRILAFFIPITLFFSIVCCILDAGEANFSKQNWIRLLSGTAASFFMISLIAGVSGAAAISILPSEFFMNTIPNTSAEFGNSRNLTSRGLLDVLITALVFGCAILILKKFSFYRDVIAIIKKIDRGFKTGLKIITVFAPLPVFSSVMCFFRNSSDSRHSCECLLKFCLAVWGALLLFALFMTVIAAIFGIQPIKHLKLIADELKNALFTGSSINQIDGLMKKCGGYAGAGIIINLGMVFGKTGTIVQAVVTLGFSALASGKELAFTEFAGLIGKSVPAVISVPNAPLGPLSVMQQLAINLGIGIDYGFLSSVDIFADLPATMITTYVLSISCMILGKWLKTSRRTDR